ncbi:MAG: ADP-ribosylglycohydrolase family protein [Thermomicrobiales bacterium]
MANTRQDRAAGAVMGALIGDALGLGCHWYYDIALLRRDCGPWVDDYRDQNAERTDRFGEIARYRHGQGLRAGDLSQTGQMIAGLLDSVADRGGYDDADYTSRLDELFETLDGSAMSGRFTDWAVRDTWANRKEGKPWGEAGSRADTSEAASRATVLAARYAGDKLTLARHLHANIRLTHAGDYIAGHSYAFAMVVAALVEGTEPADLGDRMPELFRDPTTGPLFPSFDIADQAKDPTRALDIAINPVDVPRLLGLACTIGFLVPAAYYFLHRFPDDFERAVLTAVNSGGNNMARATLTGALVGAHVGLSGIPERFIDGLTDGCRHANLASRVGSALEY